MIREQAQTPDGELDCARSRTGNGCERDRSASSYIVPGERASEQVVSVHCAQQQRAVELTAPSRTPQQVYARARASSARPRRARMTPSCMQSFHNITTGVAAAPNYGSSCVCARTTLNPCARARASSVACWRFAPSRRRARCALSRRARRRTSQCSVPPHGLRANSRCLQQLFRRLSARDLCRTPTRAQTRATM